MTEIQDLIWQLGIPSTYRGSRYLREAITLALEDEDRLLSVAKELYPMVADKFETDKTCVERNLRTVVCNCWARGNRPLLNQLAGYDLLDRPTTGEFISILSSYLIRSHAQTFGAPSPLSPVFSPKISSKASISTRHCVQNQALPFCVEREGEAVVSLCLISNGL